MSDRYSIGEVAAMLGISPHTIRAWERRYGVLRPERTPTRQRRYSEEDIDLLREVKRAADSTGVSLKLAFRASSRSGAGPIRVQPRPSGRRSPSHDADSNASRWSAVTELVSEAVFVLDKDGQVIDVNTAVARLLGKTRQRVAGRPFTDLVDSFDRSKAVLMYRPRPRAVASWELNLLTPGGTRLFSFRALPARVGRGWGVIVVGSPVGSGQAPWARSTAAGADAAFRLIERGGLAVLAVAADPELTVTYVSPALEHTPLGDGLSRGRPLRGVLKDPRLPGACRQVLESGRSIRLQAVLESAPVPRGDPTFWDLYLHPLLDPGEAPDGLLIVARDVTQIMQNGRELEAMLGADGFDAAVTMEELADVALGHLVGLSPDLDFAVVLPASPGGARPVLAATPGWEAGAEQLIEEVVHAVAKHGGRAELQGQDARGRTTLTALPLRLGLRAPGPAGAIAWRRPADRSLEIRESLGIRVVRARLRAAAEILELRERLREAAGSLDATLGLAAASARPPGDGDIDGVLASIGRRLRAAWVAVGQVGEGGLLVRAVWPHAAGAVAPGERIDPGTDFIVEAVRAREPIATARLPEELRRVATVPEPINHAIAIPLQDGGIVVAARSDPDDRVLDATGLKVVEGLGALALRIAG